MSDYKKAILAGGCFWGMQDLIRKQPGVVSTRVGYTGGENANATYRNHPGHAEAIEIVFDPAQTDYRALLEFFFQIHDPTTKNRQGNDVGTSYRSAIFYVDDEQKRVALDTIADVDASGLWPGKVVTEVTPAGDFWEAEPEHQDYLERYPNGYTCHFPRPGLEAAQAREAGPRVTLRSLCASGVARRCTTMRPPSFGVKATPAECTFSSGAVVVSMMKCRNTVRSTTSISTLANAAPTQRRVPPPNGMQANVGGRLPMYRCGSNRSGVGKVFGAVVQLARCRRRSNSPAGSPIRRARRSARRHACRRSR